MTFLLTSTGVKTPSIHSALVDLLGKPVAESSALCIPTAVYALPGGAGHASRQVAAGEEWTSKAQVRPTQPAS